jgi:hypothetical protein
MPRILVCLAAVAVLATGCRERKRKLSVASNPPIAAARVLPSPARAR